EFAKRFKLDIKPVVLADYGNPHPAAEYVEGVVIVPYNPKTGKYLALDKWAGGIGLVGGGRDKNESFEECALRELAEETGLRKVDQLIRLGEPIYSHYYNNLKDKYKRSLGHNYLAIVSDTTVGETRREKHEKFEPAWMDMPVIRQGIEKLRD